jgi:hypothetical protein
MWWTIAYRILFELAQKAGKFQVCECLGQGEWWICNNHSDDLTLFCMAEQLWAEKVGLA